MTSLSCPKPSEAERENISLIHALTPRNFGPLPASHVEKTIFITVLGFIMFAGFVLNIILIAWIVKGRRKRVSVDGYIISLSIADLLTVTARLPIQIDLLFKDFNFVAGLSQKAANVLCKGTTYLQTAFLVISLTTLVTTAIDRYIAICHSLYHHTGCKKKHTTVAILTISIWIVGLLVGIIDAVDVRISLDYGQKANYQQYGYENEDEFLGGEIIFVADVEYYQKFKKLIPVLDESTCEFKYFAVCRSTTNDWFMIPLFVIAYIIPTLVLAFCYISIIHRLCLRKPVGNVQSTSQRTSAVMVSTRRNAISMMTLFLVFGCLWLPYWCKKLKWYVEVTHNKVKQEPQSFDTVDLAVTAISYLAILSTPIIYLCMDREFMTKMKDILCSRCIATRST